MLLQNHAVHVAHVVILITTVLGCDRPPQVAIVSDGGGSLANAATEVTAVDTPAKAPNGASTARSWPHWLGPTNNGISPEAGWSTEWPAAGLKQVWTAEVGIGFSSFAIAHGKVVTLGWRDDQETVFCLSETTGEVLWKRSYAGKKVDNLHDGGPAATPSIDGDYVYTLGREGQLFCLMLSDGAIVWQKSLANEAKVATPEWGFTSSPRIVGDMVILDGGRVIALHKKTGEKLWQSKEKFRPGYGTAVDFVRGGETLIAVFNNDCLLIVKAADGSEVTRHEWETQYATTSTTPLIHGDTIFLSAGYGRGCALLKWKNAVLEEVYDNKNLANHFNNSVLWQGHLYGIDGNTHTARLGKIVCLDHATGEVKWSHRGYGVGSLLISDGKCLVLSDSGDLVACRASPDKYEELAKAKILDGLCWTVPVLLNGHVFARNAEGTVVCVKLP